jgi:hypothetical protein
MTPPEVRFDAKVAKTDGCWNWSAAINSKGYGVVSQFGRLHLAHRAAFRRFIGPIPAGMAIDHTCGNRRCVRPEHLEAVTTTENNRRSRIRKAARLAGSLATSRLVF